MGRKSRENRRLRQAAALTTRTDSAPPAPARTVRLDGWESTITGLGVMGRDKRLAARVGASKQVSQQEADDLFHGNDLANRICSLPAEELFRQWIEFKIDADPDEAEGTADTRAELVTDVMQALQTLGAQRHLTEAEVWARVHGGAAVYVGADMGPTDDPAEPLDLARVQAVRFLHVYDRHELRVASYNVDKTSPDYGQPELYEVVTPIEFYASGQVTKNAPKVGQKIHASRVLHFDGARTSRARRRTNAGWGDSVFVRLHDVLRGYGVAWDSAEALMQDFAQAVIKMKGLAEAVATGGEDLVKERIELLNYSRSVIRAMLLDADNEDFKREPTPLTGLPDLLDRWLQRMSSACGLPITLLFGMSPGGLNATGDNDVRNFYDKIKADQETRIRPLVEKLLTILLSAKEGPTGGRVPDGWSFTFCPLWQMSDEQKADLRLKVAQADEIYLVNQVARPDEVAASRFGGDDYSIDTTLDRETRDTMAEAMATAPVPVPGAEGAPAGGVVPGAAGGVDLQKQAFNGAQVASALEIMKAVAAGEVPRESAQALFELAFQLDPADAARMVPPPGFKPPKPEPTPAPGGFGLKPPPKPGEA